jgi:hypothetical protein
MVPTVPAPHLTYLDQRLPSIPSIGTFLVPSTSQHAVHQPHHSRLFGCHTALWPLSCPGSISTYYRMFESTGLMGILTLRVLV